MYDFKQIETYHDHIQLQSLLEEFGPTKITNQIIELRSDVKTYGVFLNKLLATASVFFEQKLIHSGGVVAHIEDVVVTPEYRGKNVGSFLMKNMIDLCKTWNCYKIILNCNENVKSFYEKLGFFHHDCGMRLNLS